MMNKNEGHPLSDYVQPKRAAEILGVQPNRIYEYISDGRLPAEKRGKLHFILIQDVESFKANPIGRARVKPTLWHAYKDDVTLLSTEIDVQVRASQQQHLREKLQAIQIENRHLFPKTIARYVLQEDETLNSVHILLFWKSSELPSEEQRQTHISALQAELADVLDWETARIQTRSALIHT
jgi:Helix-turn-helix domain